MAKKRKMKSSRSSSKGKYALVFGSRSKPVLGKQRFSKKPIGIVKVVKKKKK